MTIEAKVVLDSIAENGARLTTFELTYPRFIHAELMTHRTFSRSSASSRAIPTKKKIERIREDMAKPSEWGVNQSGMQAAGPLPQEEAERAEMVWEAAGSASLAFAEVLDSMGLHKQVANRIIEPWDHITVVVTTTKLSNHWKLRLEVDPETGRPLADPTYFELAQKWKIAFDESIPYPVKDGDWHLPYVWHDSRPTLCGKVRGLHPRDHDDMGDQPIDVLKKVSVARVARTSYMRQGQGDLKDNLALHERLSSNGHWSPFEPIATPIPGIRLVDSSKCLEMNVSAFGRIGCPCGGTGRGAVIPRYEGKIWLCMKCALGHVTSGNFVGWHQYRKEFPNEAGGD